MGFFPPLVKNDLVKPETAKSWLLSDCGLPDGTASPDLQREIQ